MFDYKKYIQENRLGPYSRDKAKTGLINEEYGAEESYATEEESVGIDEENPWMKEVDGTEAYGVGDFTCNYVHPGILIWSYGNVPISKLAVAATPNFDGDGTTPIQLDVDQKTEFETTLNKSEFADFNEYAAAVKPYLDKISSHGYVSSMAGNYPSDVSEAPKPPAPEDVHEPEEESEYFDRMWHVAGDDLKKVIDNLRSSGVDDEDIKQLMLTAVDLYDQAFSESVSEDSTVVI